MRLRSSLTRVLGLGRRWGLALGLGAPAMMFLLAAAGASCGGDDTAVLPGAATGAGGGQGGAGQGGAGQGGGGQGGAGGGATGCDPAVTTCPCDEGACPGGTQCIEGLCLEGCTFSYECGPGKVCANGECTLYCDDNVPCPEAGTACVNGICIPDPQNPACDAQNPCPDAGDICINGVCATACDTNSDCPDGEVCNASTGACMIDPSPAPGCMPSGMCGGVGQACEADGYCHYGCSNVQECQLIDSRFIACDQGICKTEEEVNPECTLESPCPAGQDCISNHCL